MTPKHSSLIASLRKRLESEGFPAEVINECIHDEWMELAREVAYRLGKELADDPDDPLVAKDG